MQDPQQIRNAPARRRILWLAPILNAYKLRFLNRLVARGKLDITVLRGVVDRRLQELGHNEGRDRPIFPLIDVNANESSFQLRLETYRTIARLLRKDRFDYVLLPSELKHFGVTFFLFLLKHYHGFALVTYTHPNLAKSWPAGLSRLATKFVFRLHDKVIFYTDRAREMSVRSGIVSAQKAFFANNTLDTDEIWGIYSFEVNKSPAKRILFIGRLVPDKRIDVLLRYYEELRRHGVGLTIIGDGPERDRVKRAGSGWPEIDWLGAVTDERIICEQMRRAHLVFVPGDSGLSIVHSFCYGKPYATLADARHGPEIAYLKHWKNGLLLGAGFRENVAEIRKLLDDEAVYEICCKEAFRTAQGLSVVSWCQQVEAALC